MVTFEEAWARYHHFMAEAVLWMIQEGRWPEWSWDDDCVALHASVDDSRAGTVAAEKLWIRKLLLGEALEGQHVADPVPRVFATSADLDRARTQALRSDLDQEIHRAWSSWRRAVEAVRDGGLAALAELAEENDGV
ncbi:hypothetical protein ASD06_05800 [Angustibacter sp. Root456]|nr:hypothetical protein ASD06_05800 [Angustibacter sp. Root456]